MSETQQSRGAAARLRLLGHPVRLALLDELSKAPRYVTDIQDLLEVRQANVSQHLAVLRQARIVDYHEEGNLRYHYILRPELVRDLMRFAGRDYPARSKTPAQVRRAAGSRQNRSTTQPATA